MYYWNNKEARAEKAKSHTAHMKNRYDAEIKHSIENTIVYGGPDKIPVPLLGYQAPKITIAKKDTITAAFDYLEGETAILNFASYKNPGGMFLNGSSAQEESICHESFLYNVLSCFENTYYAWNRRKLNKSLYTNRALFSPDVVIERDNEPVIKCDVITCAAPNYISASKYNNISKEENKLALEQRIRFVKEIAEENHVNTLILGAYGCGVFGQNPYETAQIFKSVFSETSIKHIVFAIPDDKNLIPFKKIFE